MLHLKTNIKRVFLFFLLFALPALGAAATYSDLYADNLSATNDSLQQYIAEANNLWSKEKSDLELAFQLLAKATKDDASHYYDLATNFYFWSINSASFEQEKSVIEKEVARLMPLIPDSAKKKWETLLNEEDPQLLREIIGFWRTADPFSATSLNERLIEHWQRINYAQSNFTKSGSSPYGTDERGTFYVRLGAPDKVTTVDINLSHVNDPLTGQIINFELGTLVNTEVEMWEYNGGEHEDDYIFLFGRKGGSGEFGWRQDVLSFVDKQSTRVAFRTSSWRPNSVIGKISENALRLGLYEQLAPHHSHFRGMYNQIASTLRGGGNINQPWIRRFQTYTGDAEMRTYHELFRSKSLAPANKTSLKSEQEDFSILTKTYRFLNDNNENEYLFSIKPSSDALADSLRSLFISQKLYVFDHQWHTLSEIDDLRPVEMGKDNTFTYQIDQSAVQNEIYFSSELIDTTRNDILIPGRINPKTSAIVKATGKRRVSFVNPLKQNEPLLISDIVIGDGQKANDNNRLPITPSLDMKFDQESDIMIYFETYNLPPSGYSFTYYFKRKRWLLGPKKVDEKSEVTILTEDVEERNSHLFSINLSVLEPGSYELFFEFSPINEASGIDSKERAVELEITKDE